MYIDPLLFQTGAMQEGDNLDAGAGVIGAKRHNKLRKLDRE